MHNLNEKAKQIQLLILDVDGVLTTGIIYYGNEGLEQRGFHVHDGLGIQLLQKAGIEIGVITAKKSENVIKRLKDLHIEHAYLGQENKMAAFEDIKKKLHLTDQVIAYMGDDLPDLAILRRVGLAITVPKAPELLRQTAHLITTREGGNGAVREVCDFILMAKDQYQQVIEQYQ